MWEKEAALRLYFHLLDSKKKGRVQSKMSCLEETSMHAVPSPVGDSYAEESNKVDLK